MEDAHAHVLDLDNKSDEPATKLESRRSFFAVYDGHGGKRIARITPSCALSKADHCCCHLLPTGATVARYAGDTVHSRMLGTEEYKAQKWEDALKRTFLATDEDMRASQ